MQFIGLKLTVINDAYVCRRTYRGLDLFQWQKRLAFATLWSKICD